MNWIESISKAIQYIEENITEDINIDDISKHAYTSSFYFQKGFAMLCGYTISEYIRNRRLSLAGNDLMNSDEKIIDIAIKYGYDSPDSFTKAFIRFHGVTPTAVRKKGATIKEFVPLKVSFNLKGGYTMEYRIEEKDAFNVIGLSKTIKYEKAYEDVPKFWNAFFMKSAFKNINAKYGINIDSEMGGSEFEYMIGDDYNSNMKIPNGFITKEIPKFIWAIFTCTGPANKSIKETNEKIFKEWLPNSNNYEIAAGYNIEMYSNPKDYKKGVNDEKYYCEIWIPIKKK